MNIFWLDRDLRLAAYCHHDKHISNQLKEAAQIICTVVREYGEPNETTYRSTHKSHPCVRWCASSMDNLILLRDFAICLHNEFAFRYNASHDPLDNDSSASVCHRSYVTITSQFFHKINIPSIGVTPVPLCMPDEYKCDDVIKSYRQYYLAEKIQGHNWRPRKPPLWVALNNPDQPTI